MLTLAEAVKYGKIQEFIAQEEARGVGPIDRAKFDALLGKAATEPRSEGRTSRSAYAGNSTGTRTRQGKRPSAPRMNVRLMQWTF
jgi:hypothetical protein